MKYDSYITFTEDVEIKCSFIVTESNVNDLRDEALNNNDASAQFIIGKLFYDAQNYEQAADYFYKAAQQSYAPAEHYVALCYFNGYGVKEDEESCIYRMSQAVNDGDATAAYFLGVHFDESMTEKPFYNQNNRISVFWYFVGAKMGNKACMYNLGINYQNGVGVDQCDTFYIYWCNKATESGTFILDWRRKNPRLALSSAQIKLLENKIFKHRVTEFGKYKKDWRKDEKEPLEWIVCAENDDYMVLISKDCIKKMSYSDNLEYGWKNSKIRAFINNDFINDAFSEEEKARILPKYAQNELNPVYGTGTGNSSVDFVSIPDTFDVAYLLNIDEWGCYDNSSPGGFRILGKKNYDSWWLRNSGMPTKKFNALYPIKTNNFLYCFVNAEGKINYEGQDSSIPICGVRPLIFVKKEETLSSNTVLKDELDKNGEANSFESKFLKAKNAFELLNNKKMKRLKLFSKK